MRIAPFAVPTGLLVTGAVELPMNAAAWYRRPRMVRPGAASLIDFLVKQPPYVSASERCP